MRLHRRRLARVMEREEKGPKLSKPKHLDAWLPLRRVEHTPPTNEVKGWMQILYQKRPRTWLGRLWSAVRSRGSWA